MATSAADERWLRRAIELAGCGMEAGDGGPFGSVVVAGDELVSEAWNRVLATPDPTAHAEVEAIRAAARSLGRFELTGCTLYASCEPCPMCLAAALWARVDRVVFAASRGDAEAVGFDDAAFYEQLTRPAAERNLAVEQLLPEEGRASLRRWLDFEGRQHY